MIKAADLRRRWKRDPIAFITQVLINPETKRPFDLYPAQTTFLRAAFTPDSTGDLPAPLAVFSAPKKSGKTTLAAKIAIYAAVCLAPPYGEVIVVANDLEQARSRVWDSAARIIQFSPLLRNSVKQTNNTIRFTSTGVTITAIASDYAGAAGASPTLVVADELWAFTSERSHRLWDELVPVPNRKPSCRLVTTYAGFSGESDLLESIYKKALSGEQIGPSLYRSPRMIAYWSNEPPAPWQDERWLADMRESLRPNQYRRMIQNQWVASDETFLSLDEWDSITDPASAPIFEDRNLTVFAGCDASVKHDSTSIVAVAWERGGGPLTPRGPQPSDRLRLINVATFQPSPDRPLDFEATVEATLLDWRLRYHLKEVRFDPFQMVATAQRLRRSGINIVEYPQSLPNLSAMASNLYELIRSRTLAVFSDEPLRRAAAQAIAVEGARGWKIDKSKQSHKIDPLIALCMAALSAVQGKGVFPPPRMWNFMTGEAMPLGALHEHDLPTWDIGFVTPWGVRVSDEVNRR